MARRIFTSAAWGGSGAPVDCGIVDGVQTYKYLTIDQALAACQDGDSVTEDATSAAFKDAAGFPLQTITIPMGGNLTISAAITLYGARSRIRLDGGGLYRFSSSGAINVADVDFVRMTHATFVPISLAASGTFTRCLFAGCKTGANYATLNLQPPSGTQATLTLTDCAFVCNACAYQIDAFANEGGSITATRCVGLLYEQFNNIDCVNLRNKAQAEVNALGFVKPSKVYDPNNPGYYTDGTAWTNADWQNVDLRLLSTSQYATGGTSVTSAATVYDLSGNKRKVGGARGAYECLSDVTHWSYCSPTWAKIEYSDETAPRITNITPYHIVNNAAIKTAFLVYFPVGSGAITSTNGTTWTARPSYSPDRGAVDNWTPVLYIAYGTAAGGPTSGITTVRRHTEPTEDAVPTPTFGSNLGWTNAARSAMIATAPTSASVCYLGDNRAYRSTAATVSKIYVAGWTTADLGDLTATVELGKGATVKTSGKITITGENDTSANLLNRVQLRDSAELTLKNCVISD